MRPTLIVITGPPASGKTTTARQIARKLAIPVIEKDVFKERLYETFGTGDDVESRIEEAALAILLSVLESQLAAGTSVVAESNFDSRQEPALRRLTEEYGHALVQIHVARPAAEVAARFAERARSGSRHPGHGDEPHDAVEVLADVETGRYDPLDLPGTLIEYDPETDSLDRVVAALGGGGDGDRD